MIMALKSKYAEKAEIPADLAGYYSERDGAWHLDVEGLVAREKVDEFRQTNIRLSKEVEQLKTRFAGIDPESVVQLAEEKRKAEEQLALKNGEVDKVVVARIKPLQDELAKMKQHREALEKQLRDTQVNQTVLAAAERKGLRATAVEDVLLRASKAIKIDNGMTVVVEPESGQTRYGGDGVTPMSIDAWVDELSNSARHLFESSAGGGANGNGSGGAGSSGGGEVNPWKRETLNITRQSEIFRKDPSRARRLAALAGVRLP